MVIKTWRPRLLLVALLLAAATSGCASGDATPRGTRVVVVQRDFKLALNSKSVRAGLVTFHVENHGPSSHELKVDKTWLWPDNLPLWANSLQVDEASPLVNSVGTVDEIRVGSSRDLTVRLTPGHYVLYCNFEGHYLGGMNVELEVTA